MIKLFCPQHLFSLFLQKTVNMTRIINICLFLFLAHSSLAQNLSWNDLFPINQRRAICELDTAAWFVEPDSIVTPLLIDTDDFYSAVAQSRKPLPIIPGLLSPVVFDHYRYLEPQQLLEPKAETHTFFPHTAEWLGDLKRNLAISEQLKQNFMLNHPDMVDYNESMLPEVPKTFRAYIDPSTARVEFEEIKVLQSDVKDELVAKIDQLNWISTFDASLQFSQAYISPNWYQGGNNNLNMIGQLLYNIKLNQKRHPNYLFDATIQYKAAVNSTPEDSIHNVNISEDIFQINATMGVKAAKRWFYSANVQFKTQLLHSYGTNSRKLKSAIMSPGELNVGLGMTYNISNPKKTVTFAASISPLSWNLKTCTNHEMDPTAYGIDNGRKSKNTFGSSIECNLEWKIRYNIIYHSRLFTFTDYDYAYADWEHTFDFNINRFLSTRLYVHMRYDTSMQKQPDTRWSKFQLKEILSFGIAYHFSTI